MFYTIYKTTNLINGKFYIGKHQTNDLNDGYVGSGKLLQRAIKKYGLYNFTTEILEIYTTENDMNLAEKILVVCDPEVTYNLCPGGKGGWGYVNTISRTEKQKRAAIITALNASRARSEKMKIDPVFRLSFSKKISEISKLRTKEKNGFYGKKHNEETKRKIGEKNKTMIGIKSSQYGTCWITNGQENKKIKKKDLDNWLSNGFNKGRVTLLSLNV